MPGIGAARSCNAGLLRGQQVCGNACRAMWRVHCTTCGNRTCVAVCAPQRAGCQETPGMHPTCPALTVSAPQLGMRTVTAQTQRHHCAPSSVLAGARRHICGRAWLRRRHTVAPWTRGATRQGCTGGLRLAAPDPTWYSQCFPPTGVVCWALRGGPDGRPCWRTWPTTARLTAHSWRNQLSIDPCTQFRSHHTTAGPLQAPCTRSPDAPSPAPSPEHNGHGAACSDHEGQPRGGAGSRGRGPPGAGRGAGGARGRGRGRARGDRDVHHPEQGRLLHAPPRDCAQLLPHRARRGGLCEPRGDRARRVRLQRQQLHRWGARAAAVRLPPLRPRRAGPPARPSHAPCVLASARRAVARSRAGRGLGGGGARTATCTPVPLEGARAAGPVCDRRRPRCLEAPRLDSGGRSSSRRTPRRRPRPCADPPRAARPTPQPPQP